MTLPLEIENRMEAIRSVVEQNGTELIELLYRRANQRAILTFLVDKPGGITLEECAEINRRLGFYFDQLAEKGDENVGFLKGAYFLEVNSPGLDRLLKTPKDFQRALEQMLRVQIRDERGAVTTLIGKLVGITDAGIELRFADDSHKSLRLDEIFKATRDVSLKR